MQNSIYYYSATGNSLYAAQTLAQELGDCRLVSMPAWWQEATVVPDSSSIGLVFPMHYFGVPPVVAEFVAKLDLTGVDYIFAVATCGSTLMCNVFKELEQLLAAKGKRLDAGFYVRMVDNYLPMFPVPNEKVQRKILAKSDKKIAYVADSSNRKDNAGIKSV